MNLKRTYFIVTLALVVFYTLMCVLGSEDYVSESSIEIHAGNGQVAWMVADFHNWHKWQQNIKEDEIEPIITGEAMMAGHAMMLPNGERNERFTLKAIYAQPSWVDQIYFERDVWVNGQKTPAESGNLMFEIYSAKSGNVGLRCKIQQGKVPFLFRGMIFVLGGNDQLNRWNEANLLSIKKVLEG
jgi:hypothetical protein